MRPRVLLFDIDGTLITTAGAGRRALNRALETLYGKANTLESIRLDGMTDHAIVRIALASLGQPFTPAALQAVLERYMENLEDEVRRVPEGHYKVHEGVHAAVEAALKNARTAVGLGTGNVRDGARIKLSRAGLHEHFSFGGFGSDAESRPELIRHGALRGAALLGEPLEACQVVVIGDTPKDVDAAHAIGAQCIGVATGSFSVEQLRAAGADFAFPHLASPGALDALLGLSAGGVAA